MSRSLYLLILLWVILTLPLAGCGGKLAPTPTPSRSPSPTASPPVSPTLSPSPGPTISPPSTPPQVEESPTPPLPSPTPSEGRIAGTLVAEQIPLSATATSRAVVIAINAQNYIVGAIAEVTDPATFDFLLPQAPYVLFGCYLDLEKSFLLRVNSGVVFPGEEASLHQELALRSARTALLPSPGEGSIRLASFSTEVKVGIPQNLAPPSENSKPIATMGDFVIDDPTSALGDAGGGIRDIAFVSLFGAVGRELTFVDTSEAFRRAVEREVELYNAGMLDPTTWIEPHLLTPEYRVGGKVQIRDGMIHIAMNVKNIESGDLFLEREMSGSLEECVDLLDSLAGEVGAEMAQAIVRYEAGELAPLPPTPELEEITPALEELNVELERLEAALEPILAGFSPDCSQHAWGINNYLLSIKSQAHLLRNAVNTLKSWLETPTTYVNRELKESGIAMARDNIRTSLERLESELLGLAERIREAREAGCLSAAETSLLKEHVDDVSVALDDLVYMFGLGTA